MHQEALLIETLFTVTRGAMNTPEAVREAAQGRSWDAEKREWTDTPSDAVAIDDPVYADARARYQKTRAEANGKTFPYYYEVLGVSVCPPLPLVFVTVTMLLRCGTEMSRTGSPRANRKHCHG